MSTGSPSSRSSSSKPSQSLADSQALAESQLRAKRFVQSAYEMAMKNDPIVGFSADGKTLEIRDVPRLCEEVLPKYFKHKNISSFFRQLNMYGFEKVGKFPVPTTSTFFLRKSTGSNSGTEMANSETRLLGSTAYDGAAHAFRHDFFRRDMPDLLDQVSRSNSTRKTSRIRRSDSGSKAVMNSKMRSGEEEDLDDDPNESSISPSHSRKIKAEQPRRFPPSDALQTKLKPFVYAAYEMVTNNEGPYIGFSIDGNALEIRDVTLFSEKILPKYFKHKNISSFIRQLNMYGFEKIDGIVSKTSPTTTFVPHTFYHEYFRRGREEMLPLIVRKTKVKKNEYDENPSKKMRGNDDEISNSPDTSSASLNSSSKKITRFIESAYDMAVRGGHPEVGMSTDGTVLEIRDFSNFSRIVLPQYFNHRDFNAFLRQLSMYGFDKVGENRYKHPYFIKNREDLLDKVVPAHSAMDVTTSAPIKSVWMNDEITNPGPAALLQLKQSPKNNSTPSLQALLGTLNASSSNPALAEITTRFQPVPSHPLNMLANAQKLQSLLHASMSNTSFHPSSTSATTLSTSLPTQSEENKLVDPAVMKDSAKQHVHSAKENHASSAAASKFPPPIALPSSATSSSGSSDSLVNAGNSINPDADFQVQAATMSAAKQNRISEAGREELLPDSEVDEELDENDEDVDDEEEEVSDSEMEDSSQNTNAIKDKVGDYRKLQRSRGTPPFVHSAYDIVQLDNDAIGWNMAGTALEIRDESKLASEILPKFFKHNNVSSFVRQLNMYGFEKTVGHINAVHTFQHENFRRNRPDLLVLINRKQNKNGTSVVSSTAISKRMQIDMNHLDNRAKKSELFMRKEASLHESKLSQSIQSSSARQHVMSTRTKPTPFVHSTYELACLNNEAIGFSRNGDSIEIRNEALLAELYLPKYFKHKNVSSFIRQLNMYGFEKVESASGVIHTFQHEFFEQNRDDLLSKITRKHVKLGNNNNTIDSPVDSGVDEAEPMDTDLSLKSGAASNERRHSGTFDAVTGLAMLKNGTPNQGPALSLSSSALGKSQSQPGISSSTLPNSRMSLFGWENPTSLTSLESNSASVGVAFDRTSSLNGSTVGTLPFNPMVLNGLPQFNMFSRLNQPLSSSIQPSNIGGSFPLDLRGSNSYNFRAPFPELPASSAAVGIVGSKLTSDESSLSRLAPPAFFPENHVCPNAAIAGLISQFGNGGQHHQPLAFSTPRYSTDAAQPAVNSSNVGENAS